MTGEPAGQDGEVRLKDGSWGPPPVRTVNDLLELLRKELVTGDPQHQVVYAQGDNRVVCSCGGYFTTVAMWGTSVPAGPSGLEQWAKHQAEGYAEKWGAFAEPKRWHTHMGD